LEHCVQPSTCSAKEGAEGAWSGLAPTQRIQWGVLRTFLQEFNRVRTGSSHTLHPEQRQGYILRRTGLNLRQLMTESPHGTRRGPGPRGGSPRRPPRRGAHVPVSGTVTGRGPCQTLVVLPVGCPTVHDWQSRGRFSECHSEKWASTRRGRYSAACGSQPMGLLQTISYD
jgi:hypothetical protein